MVPEEILKKIPKVDLHCHLDGCVRTPTIIELAKKQKVKLPTEDIEELNKYVQVSPDCRSLTEFLKAFEFFYPLLKNPYAVEKIGYELCEDAASENIKYLEVRFAPFLQAAENFNITDVVKICLDGLGQGSRDFKIGVGLILCCYRSIPKEANITTVELAKKYSDNGIVALDLAGDETRYPTRDFAEPFVLAKKYKIPFTVHAGESAGPESIKEAVKLGASRIGHGVHLIDDTNLMEEIKEKEIPLEMCITSNVQTHVVADFESHPIKKFYDKGVIVTINTDDRSVSGIDLTNEYNVAVNRLGFDVSDLTKIIHNGINALFIPNKNKVELNKIFETEINALKITR
ncbi:MAG: adenosine deaminase [Elusimicrobia bacterium CG06_land_8_20_14_3_00_38_11]|nr:MAG: adenosine deaminase [Elusimicrobia bacterium CG06_land_8_20_14_3_00_38_11]